MTKTFKIGDRVRHIEDGREVIVTEVIGTEFGCTKYPGCLSSMDRFELVETELERLVRRANSRAKALEKISRKYKDQVQWRTKFSKDGTVLIPTWSDVGEIEVGEYRIKPQSEPKATPKFITNRLFIGPKHTDGEGQWAVTLSDDGVSVNVGCLVFDVDFLIEGLTTLTGGHYHTHSSSGKELRAMRDGVFFETYRITWADAERLLAALRAVGEK